MTNRRFLKSQRGFTLIELLVVVAIIGILATLVLISLGSARSRARDARINAEITQIATQCELNADVDGNYLNCAVSNAPIALLVKDIDFQNGGGAAPTITLGSDNTRFCIETDLATLTAGATPTHRNVCRDSDGNVTPPSGGDPTKVGCVAATALCDSDPAT